MMMYKLEFVHVLQEREIYEDGCGEGVQEHGAAVEMSMSYKMCCVLECMNNKSCT